jgi:tetratricopeptide (TPR) repeat protein
MQAPAPALAVPVVLALVIGASRLALADPGDPANAEALIAAGVSLRAEGRDLEALQLFERALALAPTPRAIAQVALAQQALGHWVEAEDGLSRALSVTPQDPWIERNRLALEQALATVHGRLAWITVTTQAPGAEIWIDGRAVPSPMRDPARIPAGDVVVLVRAAGYEPAARYLQVFAGDFATQAVDPVPLPAPPRVAVGDRAVKEGHAPAASPPAPSRSNEAAWVSLGAAGVLLAGGIAAHATREVDAAHYNSPGCLANPNETRDQQCGPYASATRTATVFAVVGYFGAGVATLASAYFLLSGRQAKAHRPVAESACDLGLSGITCSVEF